jgi:arginyl-tRNA synthetase
MDYIKEALEKFLKKELKTEITLEIPPNPNLGDYALPCFELAKKHKKDPITLAKDLEQKLKSKLPAQIDTLKATGPYLNFYLNNKKITKEILSKILKEKTKYGNTSLGKNKTIVIDMSSPNIAKPFGIGHLRSTIIGNSIYKMLTSQGYKVYRINHLGDWGTQFGNLIYAFKKWGNHKDLKKDPIKYLLHLYVKFHKEAEKDPALKEQGRAWFKKLEQGNKEALKLWKEFKELSLKEFKKIYKKLNVSFDYYTGESFYNKILNNTISLIKSKKIAKISQGALVVDLSKYNLPPALLIKSDGTTLYLIRDLTAAIYRKKTFKFHKLIYEVGSEQKTYFKQLFKILELLGFSWHKDCIHVDHGLYLGKDLKKLATRKGKTFHMEDILSECTQKAKQIISQKNPKLKNKEKIAQDIAIAAIIFGDLINDRTKDIVFDINKFLSFEGETGPYLQYTYVRLNSILRKAKKIKKNIDPSLYDAQEINLIKYLGQFQNTIQDSLKDYKPHKLARYLLNLAKQTNSYYTTHPILTEKPNIKNARLILISAIAITLKKGLSLLGIKTPKEM